MTDERAANVEGGATVRASREVMLAGALVVLEVPRTNMPLYMDVHRNVDADATAVMEAHQMDLDVQDRHGVAYRKYWVDEDEGAVFCLFEAPNKAAGESVHREAHGLVADEIYEVVEGE